MKALHRIFYWLEGVVGLQSRASIWAEARRLRAEVERLKAGAKKERLEHMRQLREWKDDRDAELARADRLREALQAAEVALRRCFVWVPDVSAFEGDEQEESLTKTHEWTNRAIRMAGPLLSGPPTTPEPKEEP